MSVIKLNESHKESIRHLFDIEKFMGINITEHWAFGNDSDKFNQQLYELFCNNYLGNLKYFHAYGYEQDGKIEAFISFYESNEEPSWYYTLCRSSGNNNFLKDVLDEIIAHNEEQGRLKFYTLVHIDYSKALRRFQWNDLNNERYGYFDEFIVPAKARCFYNYPWELLFKRALLPKDSIVRCNFLKQEYRFVPVIGGNI